MSFFCRLSRRHYWCTPHRSADRRLVQVCYECGAERPANEIKDDFAAQRFNHSRASARTQAERLSSPRVVEKASPRQERIAVGQGRSSKFVLVK